MPLKGVKIHVNDPPRITSDFKKLIKARQQAYSSGKTETYRYYRNLVNRERKTLRNRFVTSKVFDPLWLRDFRSQLPIPGIDSLSPHEIGNMINVAFLKPMQINVAKY